MPKDTSPTKVPDCVKTGEPESPLQVACVSLAAQIVVSSNASLSPNKLNASLHVSESITLNCPSSRSRDI
jgi:hypothetical protein